MNELENSPTVTAPPSTVSPPSPTSESPTTWLARLKSQRMLMPLGGLVLLVIGGLTLPSVRQGWTSGPTPPPGMIVEFARTASLRITVTERGHLSSLKNSTLASNVEGQTTIIHIVPEGTQVKEGDLVCELDSSVLTDNEAQQRILLTQAEAAMEQAKENLEIQKTQNESDIAAAELALELARLDLEKFLEGEYEQQRNEIKGEITLAEEELTRAEENYDFTRRLAKKGYRSQNDLEASRIAAMQKEIALGVAKEKLRVLEAYTAKRTIAELRANALEYERELDRVKVKANSALAQAEADFEARKLTYEVERSKAERLMRQIAACRMLAPQSGTIVYANESGRWGRNEQVIEEGTTVRERQAIINIPDLTQMKVDARIHESRIGLIKTGLPAIIRVDAFPGEVFRGIVESVASVPSSTNWMNRDLKEYETVVRIIEDAERVSRLRPGLTAEVEIVVEQRNNVLQVPIQSIVTVGPKRYTWVAGAGVERREVLIGVSNDQFIELRDGLKDGERVVLNPRSTFSEEISELEAQFANTRDREQANDPSLQPAPTAAEAASGGVPLAASRPTPGAARGAVAQESHP